MMKISDVHWRYRLVVSFYLISYALLSLMAGCGSGEKADPNDPSQGNGSQDAGVLTVSIQLNNRYSTDGTPVLDCSQAGVADVQCYVYEPTGRLIQQSDLRSCSTNVGDIGGIAPGEARTLVCLGLDDSGNIVQLGQIAGLTVAAGETTDAGVMDAYPFISVLDAPDDGAGVTANEFSLSWNSVPNAYHYNVQIAETSEFQPLVVDELTTRTAYSPTLLLPDTTYYWRINPIDAFGHRGADSAAARFVTLPGSSCRAPALDFIENQIVDIGEPVSFIVSANDPDPGDELLFSSGPLPTGALFESLTGRFTWDTAAGGAEGYYSVNFTVCDNCPETPQCDSQTVGISVGNACQPPVLEPIGPRQVMEKELLSFTLSATDPEVGSTLTYRAEFLPMGAAFDPESQTFSWTPEADAGGNYTVRFEVCDNCFESPLCDAEEVEITVGGACRSPVLDPIGNRQILEYQRLTIVPDAAIPDPNAQLTYQARHLPSGATFNTRSHTFSWTPRAEDIGNHAVNFEVCAQCADGPRCDAEEINITVGENVCRPPVLAPIGDREVVWGGAMEFKVSASDPDTDSLLTFSAEAIEDQTHPYPGFRGTFDPETQIFQDLADPFLDIDDLIPDLIRFEVCDDCAAGALCDWEEVEIKRFLSANYYTGLWLTEEIVVDSEQISAMDIASADSAVGSLSVHAYSGGGTRVDWGTSISLLNGSSGLTAVFHRSWGTGTFYIQRTSLENYLVITEYRNYSEADGREDTTLQYPLTN